MGKEGSYDQGIDREEEEERAPGNTGAVPSFIYNSFSHYIGDTRKLFMLHECWMIKSHRVFLKLYSSIFRSYSTFHTPSFQKLQTPTLSRAAEVRAGLEGVKLYLHCPSFKLPGIEGECAGEGVLVFVFFFFSISLSAFNIDWQ